MIRLNRTDPPAKLTEEFVKQKTEEFKKDEKPVWDYPWLKNALLDMSHGKCAYCECDLTHESNYMEVEHFKDKKDFPDEVLSWENLMPSCKRCNGTKSTHNVVAEPIIDPTQVTPQEHLRMVACRIIGKDALGDSTVKCLKLNNDVRKMEEKRLQISEEIDSRLDDIRRFLSSDVSHAIKRLKDLMKQCEVAKPYAAVSATFLHESSVFDDIVGSLKENRLWSRDLEEIYYDTREICLM